MSLAWFMIYWIEIQWMFTYAGIALNRLSTLHNANVLVCVRKHAHIKNNLKKTEKGVLETSITLTKF